MGTKKTVLNATYNTSTDATKLSKIHKGQTQVTLLLRLSTIHCRMNVLLILVCFNDSKSRKSSRADECEITSMTKVLNGGSSFSARHASTKELGVSQLLR